MISNITPQAGQALQSFVRIATVEQFSDAENVVVNVAINNKLVQTVACFAMRPVVALSKGDKVLIVGENLDLCFIIGILPGSATPVPSGASGYDIQQDPVSGNTRITVEKGDLELCTEQGSVKIHSAKDIEMKSSTTTLEAAKGVFNIADGAFSGVRFTASIAQSKLILGKLNTSVGRLIEKAKNVYRQVENLNQLKAGRMRTRVKGSYHLKGESLNQKAEKDVRIDGEKINLG